MAGRKNPTPRRGIPALLNAVRKRYRELNFIRYSDAAKEIGISGKTLRLIINKTSNTVHKDTEKLLRKWLDTHAPAEQHELPVDPEDTRTCGQMAYEEIITSMKDLMPVLPRDKAEWLEDKVRNAIDTALEMQADAADKLVSNLENDLAAKDEELVKLRDAGNARFQLGKDVAHMSDPERQALQGMLNKKEQENIDLRATIKSLANTL